MKKNKEFVLSTIFGKGCSMKETFIIKGDIRAKTLVIQCGAILNGRSSMSNDSGLS